MHLSNIKILQKIIMKNSVILTTVLLIVVSSFFSCDDFLEEDPRGILSTDNFYNNDREAILASNGPAEISIRSSEAFKYVSIPETPTNFA